MLSCIYSGKVYHLISYMPNYNLDKPAQVKLRRLSRDVRVFCLRGGE